MTWGASGRRADGAGRVSVVEPSTRELPGARGVGGRATPRAWAGAVENHVRSDGRGTAVDAAALQRAAGDGRLRRVRRGSYVATDA